MKKQRPKFYLARLFKRLGMVEREYIKSKEVAGKEFVTITNQKTTAQKKFFNITSQTMWTVEVRTGDVLETSRVDGIKYCTITGRVLEAGWEEISKEEAYKRVLTRK